MKTVSLLLILACLSASPCFGQVVSNVDKIIVSDSLRLRGYSASDISNDTTVSMRRQRALMTEWAVKNYVGLHGGSGGGSGSLPVATPSVLGGVKVGANMTVNPDSTLTTRGLHISDTSKFTYVGSDNGNYYLDTTHIISGSPRLAPVIVGHSNLKNLYWLQNGNRTGYFWNTVDQARQPPSNPVVVGNNNFNSFTNASSWGNYFPSVVVGSNNLNVLRNTYNWVIVGTNNVTNAVMDTLLSATVFNYQPSFGKPNVNETPNDGGSIGGTSNFFIGNNIGPNIQRVGSHNVVVGSSMNSSRTGADIISNVYGKSYDQRSSTGNNNVLIGVGTGQGVFRNGKQGGNIQIGNNPIASMLNGYGNVIIRNDLGGLEQSDDRYAVMGDSNYVVGIGTLTQLQDKTGNRQTNVNGVLMADSVGRVSLGGLHWAVSSASVDLNNSVAGGTLIKTGTTTERLAIVSPADGLLFHDKTLHCLCFYNGTKWQKVLSADVD